MSPMIQAWTVLIKEYLPLGQIIYWFSLGNKPYLKTDEPQHSSLIQSISSVHTEPVLPHTLQAAGCGLSYLLHTSTIKMFVIKANHKADVWSLKREQAHFMVLLWTHSLPMNQVGKPFEYCSYCVSKPATWKWILFSFQL